MKLKVPKSIVQSMSQFQARSNPTLDEALVNEYAERYAEGQPMDPIEVCGTPYNVMFVVDGHHRFAAMNKAGIPYNAEIEVEVVSESTDTDEVRWIAAGSNTTHGLRRTTADKKNAVLMAYNALMSRFRRSNIPADEQEGIPEKIAEHCAVSKVYVHKVLKAEQEAKQAAPEQPAPPPPPPTVQPPPPPQAPTTPPPPADSAIPPPPEQAVSPEEIARRKTVQPNPPPPPPVVDENGHANKSGAFDAFYRVIPSPLIPFWNRRGELMAEKKHLKNVIAKLKDGMDKNDPLWSGVTQATLSNLKNALQDIENSMPFIRCPVCGGMNEGCMLCGNRGGFISKWQFESIIAKDPALMKYLAPFARKAGYDVPAEADGGTPAVDAPEAEEAQQAEK